MKQSIFVARTVCEMRHAMEALRGKSIGFVPTMGALHEGHISLALRAKNENEFVVSSIYVNPTQFSPGEDLDKYPRTLEKDLSMLSAAGVEYVFHPSSDEMYPTGYLCYVEPMAFSNILEGIARPDFFRGVATMVSKLFNVVNPTRAYFGQKDISQCILIKSMVRDLHFPVEIIICPTMRESDGLAMSSRNTYLQPNERIAAPVLYRALSAAKDMCEKSSLDSILRTAIIEKAEEVLRSEPLISHIEYVSVASPIDMKELDTVEPHVGAVLSAAVRCGTVRLIDNVLVGPANDIIFS